MKRWIPHEAANHYESNRKPASRYAQLRNKCRRLGYDIQITSGQYMDLIYDAKCHYCTQPIGRTGCGLDRKDSSLGYTLENVVPCCRTCNTQKNLKSYEEFYAATAHLRPAAKKGSAFESI